MTTAFLSALGLVVLGLAAVIWSGVARRRSLHYALIVLLLAALGWAVREARIVGAGLDFSREAAPFQLAHRIFIGLTTLCVPLLTITGVRLARQEEAGRRRQHHQLAVVFVLAVIVTCSLGTVMTWLAEPLDSPAGAHGGG